MTIVRWDPFRDFGFTAGATWVPPVDVFQTGEHELVLKAELPDMTREDIDVTITLSGGTERSAAPSRCLAPWIQARWQPSTRTAC
jgi:hypothetical protein